MGHQRILTFRVYFDIPNRKTNYMSIPNNLPIIDGHTGEVVIEHIDHVIYTEDDYVIAQGDGTEAMYERSDLFVDDDQVTAVGDPIYISSEYTK